jgi:hypothetical protein
MLLKSVSGVGFSIRATGAWVVSAVSVDTPVPTVETKLAAVETVLGVRDAALVPPRVSMYASGSGI